MKIPVIITFEGFESTQAIEDQIRQQAAKLETYFDRLTSCRVSLRCPHQHKHRGRLYSVRIDMTVPDAEIVVNKRHDLDHSHEDLNVAIHDSFDAARRQLQDYVRKMRSQVKGHTRNKAGNSAAEV